MHFHVPKPLHGWRALAGEVGIIVVGVLIALGAEQALEGMHERRVATESRRDVREEVTTDIGFYRDRLEESSCIARRLSQLSDIVKVGTVPQDTVKSVGRPSDFAPFSERWRAVTSSARSAMFPSAEQGSLDEIYGIFARIEQDSETEQAAWSDLNIIRQVNGPIDSETRLVLRRAIEQARHTDAVIRLAGNYALFQARTLGIASSPETSPQGGDVHSICLPLATAPGAR